MTSRISVLTDTPSTGARNMPETAAKDAPMHPGQPADNGRVRALQAQQVRVVDHRGDGLADPGSLEE